MATPTLKGIHHVKIPVSDLDASIAWYARVLGAVHQERFDHHDVDGIRFAAILAVPGCDVPVELRWAPGAAGAMNGYDPVSFAAGDEQDVAAWAAHLDGLGVENSGMAHGAAGAMLVVADPDGTFLRILEIPVGGVQDIRMPDGPTEPEGPWLAPPSMRHPGEGGGAR